MLFKRGISLLGLGMATYDEFKALDLRVARVREASRVEGSEKLLKLIVELGAPPDGGVNETRQIVAGVGKTYEPEALIGKSIAIVANLDPRTLMGLESQGMVLAAHGEDGTPVLLFPEREVPSGSEIS